CQQMCCHEPELPVEDLNIDRAPAVRTERGIIRFGPVFLDLNIRQLERRGSPDEDSVPIRYADNVAQGTSKLHIAVGDDGHSLVMLVKFSERVTQKLELIVHHLRCRNCGIITRSSAQNAYFLERNEIRAVVMNLLGDGGRTLR